MTLSPDTFAALTAIANGDGFKARQAIRDLLPTLTVVEPEEEKKGTRTGAQNRALHLGFQLIADALNGAGLDMRAVLKPEVEMPWDKDSVKEYLFRPVMKLMRQTESTTELGKLGDIEAIWETVMRFLMQNHGIDYIPFPNEEGKGNVRLKQMENLQDESYPEMSEETLADKF